MLSDFLGVSGGAGSPQGERGAKVFGTLKCFSISYKDSEIIFEQNSLCPFK